MGRIGKPQKSKKHKKIKSIDPFYTGKRPPTRCTGEYNDPVKGKDDALPRSFRDITFVKSSKHLKKMREKSHLDRQKDNSDGVMEKGMTRPIKPVPKFVQRENESDISFFNRMERETQNVIAKAQYLSKYQIDLDALEKGETPVRKKKKKKPQTEQRLKKLKEKQHVKKGKKVDKKKSGFEHLQDTVKFGEVVMEPPDLKARPRKSRNLPEKKAGSKSLLLMDILDKNSDSKKVFPPIREVGKTMKRKLLPPLQQVIMDAEREKAIKRYRDNKARKIDKNSS